MRVGVQGGPIRYFGVLFFLRKRGHLDVLRWARENGCPWDEWTCSFAAHDGQLEVLKYARENGCPWTENTRRLAATKGYVET